MLTFTTDQLDRMLVPARNATTWEFVRALRRDHPQAVEPLGPDETFRRTAGEMRRAMNYGLDSHRDLYVFVQLAVLLGWDWHADARFGWFDEIMTDHAIPTATERLRLATDLFH